MRSYMLLVKTFVFCLVLSAPLDAYSQTLRTKVRDSAREYLMFPPYVKAAEGGRVCGLGITSYRLTVVKALDWAIESGLAIGDKFKTVNGQNVTSENFGVLMAELSPGDDVQLVLTRADSDLSVNIICSDATDKALATIAALQAASERNWQECIDNIYEADKLIGYKTYFHAFIRDQCSRAKRCGSFNCTRPTPTHVAQRYETNLLLLEYLSAVGSLGNNERWWIRAYVSAFERTGYSQYAKSLEDHLEWAQMPNPKPPAPPRVDLSVEQEN